jgi:hypothetical protein
VEDHRAAFSQEEASQGWKGPPGLGLPRSAGRDPVDLALGGSMEGPPRPFSALPDLPSVVSGLGEGRRDAEDLARFGRRSSRPRGARSLRDLYRRDVRVGKKRGPKVGKTRRGKGTKIMAIADGSSLPLALGIESASPNEIRLVEDTLKNRFTRRAPESDEADSRVAKRFGTKLIAPHRSNRKLLTQDGRELRRYRRRWRIECLFAWLHNFRRLVVRWEVKAENFLGMLELGCMLILLRRF